MSDKMNEQFYRLGRALSALCAQYNSCRWIANSRSSVMRRFAMKMKAQALIKHDRIMRGEA